MNTPDMPTAPVDLDAPTSSGDRCNPTTSNDEKGTTSMPDTIDTAPAPGLTRVQVPDVADINLDGEICRTDILAIARSGAVSGELKRWIWDDGEVVYEANINGLPDSAGTAELVAYEMAQLRDLVTVGLHLMSEWARVTKGAR